MARTRNPAPDEQMALQMIHDSLNERGYPPSQREISAACGWASPSGANTLLRLLEARGLITVTPGVSRGLRLTETGVERLVGAKMIASVETLA